MKVWANYKKRIITREASDAIHEMAIDQDTVRLTDGAKNEDFHVTFAGTIKYWLRYFNVSVGIWIPVTVEEL